MRWSQVPLLVLSKAMRYLCVTAENVVQVSVIFTYVVTRCWLVKTICAVHECMLACAGHQVLLKTQKHT